MKTAAFCFRRILFYDITLYDSTISPLRNSAYALIIWSPCCVPKFYAVIYLLSRAYLLRRYFLKSLPSQLNNNNNNNNSLIIVIFVAAEVG